MNVPGHEMAGDCTIKIRACRPNVEDNSFCFKIRIEEEIGWIGLVVTKIGGEAVDLQYPGVAGPAGHGSEKTDMTRTIQREIRRHGYSPAAGQGVSAGAGSFRLVFRAKAGLPQPFVGDYVAGGTALVVTGLVFRRQAVGIEVSAGIGGIEDVLSDRTGETGVVTRERR
jgi:hypothetical protein